MSVTRRDGFETSCRPNASGYSQQWAWNKVQAPASWDVTRGGTATVIAAVDTGVQHGHPEPDAKIVAGYDYIQNDAAPDVGNGHGTHLAGSAAAETNNSTGGAGMCPDSKVVQVRVLDNNGSGTLTNVANGTTWAPPPALRPRRAPWTMPGTRGSS